jgi:RecB family exonuclease
MKVVLPRLVLPATPLPPEVEAIEDPKPPTTPHLSYSQLAMVIRCSKQYYFRYVLGLKERPKIMLAVGKGGHAALERNGRHKIKTGEDMAMSDLLDAASTYIDAEVSNVETGDREPGDEKAKDHALIGLAVFRRRDAPLIHPAGVEIEFNLDINDEFHEPIDPINGRIDLLTTDLDVDDYKFTTRAKSQIDIDLAIQPTLYSKFVKHLTGRYPRSVGFRQFLPGNTRREPDAVHITRSAHLMTPEAQERRFARVANQFHEANRLIKAGIAIPADDPRTCSWCGYRDRCQSSLVDDFEAAKIRSQTT